MKTLRRTLAVAALALAPCVAEAGTTAVTFSSDPNTTKRKLGSFQGTASYDDAAGTLTVVLQNTSAAGTSLTGFAFDAGDVGSVTYVDGDDGATRGDEDAFDDLKSRKGTVKAKPFGKYHAGAGVNGKWAVGRRQAQNGIGAGETGTFVFDVDPASALTALDFFDGNLDIVASFRGRKIDRVGGIATVVMPSAPVVPGANPPPVVDTPDLPADTGGVVINPPVNTGGDINGGPAGGSPGGNNGGPAAVPLPPAAWPALATLAAVALPRLRRKLRETL